MRYKLITCGVVYLAGSMTIWAETDPGLYRTELVAQSETVAAWTGVAASTSPVEAQSGKGTYEWIDGSKDPGELLKVERSDGGESGVKFAVRSDSMADIMAMS